MSKCNKWFALIGKADVATKLNTPLSMSLQGFYPYSWLVIIWSHRFKLKLFDKRCRGNLTKFFLHPPIDDSKPLWIEGPVPSQQSTVLSDFYLVQKSWNLNFFFFTVYKITVVNNVLSCNLHLAVCEPSESTCLGVRAKKRFYRNYSFGPKWVVVPFLKISELLKCPCVAQCTN